MTVRSCPSQHGGREQDTGSANHTGPHVSGIVSRTSDAVRTARVHMLIYSTGCVLVTFTSLTPSRARIAGRPHTVCLFPMHIVLCKHSCVHVFISKSAAPERCLSNAAYCFVPSVGFAVLYHNRPPVLCWTRPHLFAGRKLAPILPSFLCCAPRALKSDCGSAGPSDSDCGSCWLFKSDCGSAAAFWLDLAHVCIGLFSLKAELSPFLCV